MTDPRPIFPAFLRPYRNRFLRLTVARTTDGYKAARSRLTWGADSSDATEWRMSVLSLLHDAGLVVGCFIALWLPDDAGSVVASDPRWNTEALLTFERSRA